MTQEELDEWLELFYSDAVELEEERLMKEKKRKLEDEEEKEAKAKAKKMKLEGEMKEKVVGERGLLKDVEKDNVEDVKGLSSLELEALIE